MTNNEKLALKEAAERAQVASNAYATCVISQEEFLAETSDYRTLIRGPERVLALLAERDADKKRIAELEALIAEQDKRLVSYAAIATKNASEARTVSVKLPESVIDAICLTAAEIHNLGRGVSDERAQDIIDSIRCAAGIKLEVGE